MPHSQQLTGSLRFDRTDRHTEDGPFFEVSWKGRRVGSLGSVGWPPDRIQTSRLVLREPEASDRPRLIDLAASLEVNQYVGGARSRDELEAQFPSRPRRRPGLFVVERDGLTLGCVTMDRRDPDRRGHVRPEGNEADLGYMFLPDAWGSGYATEAAAAVLHWFDHTYSGELTLLSTQLANAASLRVAAKLGFVEVERFEDYGATQWLGVRDGVEAADLAVPITTLYPAAQGEQAHG